MPHPAFSSAVRPVDPDDDAPAITVAVPRALDCVAARVDRLGGPGRRHPSFRSVVPTSDRPEPLEHWGPGVIRSDRPRSQVTFHKGQTSFEEFGVKIRETMSGVGPHEAALVTELTTRTDVTRFRMQGGVVEYGEGATTVRPDCFYHSVLEGVVVAECKADGTYLTTGRYRHVAANVRRTVEAVGLTFRRATGAAMLADPLLAGNRHRAFVDRFTSVGVDERDAVATLLAGAAGGVPIGAVADALRRPILRTRAMLHAMLCANEVHIDLSLPVTHLSLVTPVIRPADVPDITRLRLAEA